MQVKDFAYIAVAAVLFAFLLVPLRDSVVDDTFIHLQYARNLADHGELSFNRTEPTYGATSPLWVALLALLRRAGADILIWCRVLSWLFAIASIMLVYRIAARLDGGSAAPVAAAFIVAAEAWFVRWSAVGMETSLAVCMVLVCFDAALRAERSAARSAVFGLALFLAALARPEALLLAPIAVLAFLLARGARPRHFVFVAVFAPLFIAWLLVIHRHTGTYFPLTAGAKQGRPVLSALLVSRSLVPLGIMASTTLVPWLALLAGLGAAAARDRSIGSAFDERRGIREMPGTLVMLLWAVALPAAYTVLDFQVLSRYLVPVMPAAVVLGSVAARRLVRRIVRGDRARDAAFAAFAALAIVQSAVLYAAVVVPSTRAFSRGLVRSIVSMGKLIDHEAPAGAIVATPDIGAIGYYAHRRILDLGGLVSPEINRMRKSIDVDEIIERGLYLRFGPTYLVDRSETPARFAGRVIDGVLFTAVRQGAVPNLGIRKPAPVVYTLYRLDRAPADSLAAGRRGGGAP
jgi:hypothetical protein